MPTPARRSTTRPPIRHTPSSRPIVAVLTALLVGAIGAVVPAHGYAAAPHNTSLPRSFGAAPLSFEPNRGQAAAGTAFLARGHGYSVALAARGAVFTLNAPAGRAAAGRPAPIRQAVVRMDLLGGDRAAAGQGQDRLPGTVGYLGGRHNNRNDGLSHIPTYAAVRYRAVYPGVDLVYYGNAGRLEYDVRVAPGADPRRIRLSFQGAAGLRIAANGDLILRTPAGVVRQHRPVVYQLVGGARREIGGAYTLAGGAMGITVGAYNRRATLVIDPVLVYSTYYGGPGGDHINAIAVDSQGDAYVSGVTTSGFKAQTAFVSKFDPTGTQVLYTQYVNNTGGAGNATALACNSSGAGIAVDGQGNAYVTGLYGDVGSNSWDNNLCVSKAVLWLKVDPSGNAIFNAYGKYETSQGNAIALDGQGNAYITGSTDQTAQNFPVTAGAFQTTPGINKTPSGGVAGDAFVLKIDPAGTVVYGSFLGGSGIDAGLGIAVDSQGDAFVAGTSGGTVNGLSDYPVTTNALQTKPGNLWAPGFVSEISPDGSSLLYSTFLSGNNGESVNGIAVDGQGYVYVVGDTNSDNFPATPSAFQPTCGTNGMCNATKTWYCDPGTTTCYWRIQAPEDVFLSKLDTRQSGAASLVYATFLGGMNRDLGQAIAVDGHGNAYITGRTASLGDFPTRLPAQPALGGDYDAFVAKIDTTQAGAGSLVYSTYLGGSGYDVGNGIAVDGNGNAYVAGYTASTNFPTQSPAQAANNGGDSDGFLSKLSPQAPVVVNGLTLSPSAVNGGQSTTGTVTLNAPAPAGGATVTLASGNPAATAPASVVVPAGATSAPFTVATQAVGAPTSVSVSASYGGASQAATLTVNPAPVPPTATPTNSPTPTPTATPTNTPAPTNTPPATTKPGSSAGATPTNTATTPTGSAGQGAAPSPTPTSPAATGSSGSTAGAPGTLGAPGSPAGPGTAGQGSTPGAPHGSGLSLAIGRQPAQVASGSTLVVSGRTTPRVHVGAGVEVTATHATVTGKGKHRKRAVQTIVLYHIAGQGNADSHGRFTLRLRLTRVPHVPARATLTVRASAGRAAVTRTAQVTIIAPPRHTPHKHASHVRTEGRR